MGLLHSPGTRLGGKTVAMRPRRLRPPRIPQSAFKQDRSARVVIAGHAFVQNIRRGHYELATEAPMTRRLAVAFDELARAGHGDLIPEARRPSACRELAQRNRPPPGRGMTFEF